MMLRSHSGRLQGLGDLTSSIAAAIAQMEGTTQNNNPGNLMAIPGHSYIGQVGTDYRGFAIFDSMDSGQAQLARQINLNISRGLSTEQFFCGGNGYAGYAPAAGGNDCQGYAAFVAGQVGIDPNVPLNQADIPGIEWTDDSGVGIPADSGFSLDTTTLLLLAGAAALGIWAFQR